MEFNSNKAIYLQIADTVCDKILAGELKPEDRIPSVREYGATIGVNPNTVMRSFDYLQQEEIIYQRRGVGYFVSPDAKERILAEQRREFLEEELPYIRQRMKTLGISIDELTLDDVI